MLIPSLVLTLALLVGAVPFATKQDFPHLQRAQPQRNSQYKDSLGFGNKELAERDASKYVFMHHIVGNTYPYTYHDWASDFALIGAINVDAVALNIGRDAWQWDRVVDAYKAANDYNADPTRPPLHLFISFDYSSFVCDNGSATVNWTNYFAQDPAQFKVNGKTFLSTWGGGYDCLGVETWKKVKSQTNSFLMPFFWNSEQTFKTDWSFLDSWYCWGCAWPQGNWNKNTSDDLWYMDLLGSGRYATTVSGWIFTHLPDKNFYLRGDEWLITRRWEQLVQMRNQLTFVEMTTWNDYGESDYFGPFRGAQPAGTYWAENYPHQAWLDLSKYYISAYKTGSYPTITQDVIYWWCRPHFSAAVAAADQYSKPSGWNWSEDYLWAAVFCTSTCSVTLALGSSTQSFPNLPYGVSELKLPMAVGRVKLKMVKSSKTVIDASPAEFEVVATPSKYNYNVYVGAETAIIVGPTPTAISVSIPISISIPFFGTSPSSTSTPIRPTSSSLSTSGSTPSVITTTVSVVPSSTASAYLSIGCVAEGTTGSRRALTHLEKGPNASDVSNLP